MVPTACFEAKMPLMVAIRKEAIHGISLLTFVYHRIYQKYLTCTIEASTSWQHGRLEQLGYSRNDRHGRGALCYPAAGVSQRAARCSVESMSLFPTTC